MQQDRRPGRAGGQHLSRHRCEWIVHLGGRKRPPVRTGHEPRGTVLGGDVVQGQQHVEVGGGVTPALPVGVYRLVRMVVAGPRIVGVHGVPGHRRADHQLGEFQYQRIGGQLDEHLALAEQVAQPAYERCHRGLLPAGTRALVRVQVLDRVDQRRDPRCRQVALDDHVSVAPERGAQFVVVHPAIVSTAAGRSRALTANRPRSSRRAPPGGISSCGRRSVHRRRPPRPRTRDWAGTRSTGPAATRCRS